MVGEFCHGWKITKISARSFNMDIPLFTWKWKPSFLRSSSLTDFPLNRFEKNSHFFVKKNFQHQNTFHKWKARANLFLLSKRKIFIWLVFKYEKMSHSSRIWRKMNLLYKKVSLRDAPKCYQSSRKSKLFLCPPPQNLHELQIKWWNTFLAEERRFRTVS